MKKHSLYLIIISIIALFIILCLSSTPLNPETFLSANSSGDHVILENSNSFSDLEKAQTLSDLKETQSPVKIGLPVTESGRPHNTQKTEISKLFSTSGNIFFPKRFLDSSPKRKIGWKIPKMIVRDDIDYKILEMVVRKDIDYKILRTGPEINGRIMKIRGFRKFRSNN